MRLELISSSFLKDKIRDVIINLDNVQHFDIEKRIKLIDKEKKEFFKLIIFTTIPMSAYSEYHATEAIARTRLCDLLTKCGMIPAYAESVSQMFKIDDLTKKDLKDIENDNNDE